MKFNSYMQTDRHCAH